MRRVWIATAVYAVVFSALAAWRWHVWSYGSDTGTFTQAILDAPAFRNGPEGGSHFRFHFSPVLALLQPLLALSHSPLALQLAQVVLVALCAPVLFAIVRPYVEETIAIRVTYVALLYPPLASIAFGEFHEVAFFPLLALGLLWAADRGRWEWFALCGVLALCTREDICLEMAAIGIVMAIVLVARRRADAGGFLSGIALRWKVSAPAFAALGVAGAVVAATYYHVVVQLYGHWPHGHFYDYPFAQGPPAVLLALLVQPQVVLPAVVSIGRLTYLLEALLPLALLPLRTSWSALALPGFIVVFLASEQSVWRMGNHYAAMWLPWLLVGACGALFKIQQARTPEFAARWTLGALVACGVFLVAFDPMHLTHYLAPPYRDLASARAALACVPTDASVATHDEWFAEISGRYPNATIQRTSGVQYLVYAEDFPNAEFQAVELPRIRAELQARAYAPVCHFGNVVTLKRT